MPKRVDFSVWKQILLTESAENFRGVIRWDVALAGSRREINVASECPAARGLGILPHPRFHRSNILRRSPVRRLSRFLQAPGAREASRKESYLSLSRRGQSAIRYTPALKPFRRKQLLEFLPALQL